MSTIKTGTITGHPVASALTVPGTLTVGNTILTNSGVGTTTISAENGTATNIQQGLAKAWWQFDPTNSNTTDESFNISSVTDNGTGDQTGVFNNDMSGARDYNTAGHSAYKNGTLSNTNIRSLGNMLRYAGELRYHCVWVNSTNGGAAQEDQDENSWTIHGQLA